MPSSFELVIRFLLPACPPPHAELSPDEYKEKHMVLKLDLNDTDYHKDYAVEILQQYGKVSLVFCHFFQARLPGRNGSTVVSVYVEQIAQLLWCVFLMTGRLVMKCVYVYGCSVT